VVRLQGWWPAVVVALAGLVAVMALAYFKGLPIVAQWAADRLPPTLEQRVGEQVLAVLDKHHLDPSELDVAWRERLTRRFAAAAAKAAPGVRYRLEFRDTETTRINAFALPGGIIVLLDDLVESAPATTQCWACSAMSWAMSRTSTVPAAIQSVSRHLAGLQGDFGPRRCTDGPLDGDHAASREADEFASFPPRQRHIGRSADFFKVTEQESRRGVEGIPEFLATHPPTNERIARLAEEIAKEPTRPEVPADPGVVSEENARDGSSK
jgi:Zn-dependent protease with chaperone function